MTYLTLYWHGLPLGLGDRQHTVVHSRGALAEQGPFG
jgi:hypothetical protein